MSLMQQPQSYLQNFLQNAALPLFFSKFLYNPAIYTKNSLQMSQFYLTLLLQILLIPPPNPRNFLFIYIFSSLPYLEERAGSAWELKNRKIFPPYNDIILPNINPLTPNDPYMGHTAPLTSKRCILYIYSTNIGTECFKHALYSPFFLFKMQFVS